MRMKARFSLIQMDVDVFVSKYIAACKRVLSEPFSTRGVITWLLK